MAKQPDNDRTSPGADMVWSIIGLLVSGVITWGGLGWLADRWLGITLFLPIGVAVGFGVAFYLIIKRYG
jgi:F0F1-type ATP synthase assembly protein I